MSGRVTYLDGHRGLAIAMVLIFHTYGRWIHEMPAGSQFPDFLPVQYGFLGVNLFFLLSGYVILMTLERSASVGAFIYRRWLRLFPGMLFCSLLMFATAGLFPHRPEGQPGWLTLLPGLTFIDPEWWRLALGLSIPPLEGVFWTLYTEFKFYVFAALVYFWRGRTALVLALALAFAVAQLSAVLSHEWGLRPFSTVLRISMLLSFESFGWFAAGAAFYVYQATQSKPWFGVGLALAVVSALSMRYGIVANNGSWTLCALALMIAALFAGALIWSPIRTALSHPVLQYLGVASYPLYLLHQNITVSASVSLSQWFPTVWPWLLPVLPIALLVLASHAIATRLEHRLRQRIQAMLALTGIRLFAGR
jgi:peptidoglycan/LPS O-acetylase OafA/YrhL